MTKYVELNRNTNTRAQFLSAVRAALKAHGDCYSGWIDYISGACEEMDEVAKGKRTAYYHNNRADSLGLIPCNSGGSATTTNRMEIER